MAKPIGVFARRAFAFLLALCLIAGAGASGVYGALNLNHDCDGNGCPICHNIRFLLAMLSGFTQALFFTLFMEGFQTPRARPAGSVRARRAAITPVLRFDRIND